MEEWLLHLHNPVIIHIVLFFALLGGAIGLPIPEDIPLIVGGIFVYREVTSFQFTVFSCYCGVILGDLIVYFIGRRFGPSLFQQKWFRRRVSRKKLQDLKIRIEKRSLPMIFIARHLFYLRSATFLTCGAVKMEFRRFLFADALAALLSVPVMVWLGIKCAEQYQALTAFLDKATLISFLLLAIVIALWLFLRYLRKRREENEKSRSIPGV